MVLTRIATRVVHASRSRPWLVIALVVLIASGAGVLAARTLTVNTDTTALFDRDLPFRVSEREFDRQFPNEAGLTVVVIDGPTLPAAQRAADDLVARLSADPLFLNVINPTGGAFFRENGVLYLSAAEIDSLSGSLADAQPLLGAVAADPSARGVIRLLELAFQAAASGDSSAAQIAPAASRIAEAVEAAVEGRPASVEWSALVAPLTGSGPPRALVLARPRLDLTALEQGAAGTASIRAHARDMDLTADNGFRVRLTGDVPLSDEEFATIASGTTVAGLLAVAGVSILMVLALGSFRLAGITLATLVVGFVLTLGWAAISVGEINLISIAFTFMFVGIAVDFAMQYCLHYRAERLKRGSTDDAAALDAAGGSMAEPLMLGAATVAAGFFCFLPTAYRGVSELGVIAGGGIIIAFLLNFTLMPALLRLVPLKPETKAVGFSWAARPNQALLRSRARVITAALVLASGAGLALPRLVFDFDPMKLKDPDTESMATALELMDDPLINATTVSILVRDADDVRPLAEKLKGLPEVREVRSVFDLVPEDQDIKLGAIADMALFLEPVLAPIAVQPSPDPADIASAARAAHAAAQAALLAPGGSEPLRAAAVRTRDALARFLAQTEPAVAARLSSDLTAGFDAALEPLRAMLRAAPVTLESLPAAIREGYIALDGRYRVQVFPADSSRDIDEMARFTRAVRSVAPDAIGAPVIIYESGRIVTGAFATAGGLGLVAVTLLLLATFRRVDDVLRVLAPLLLAVTLTLGTCALIGFPLNFANIIALPLLLAVGVAYPIHFVAAWREGETLLLSSPAGRGMLFSALTDTAAFGSMSLATHNGTASMGMLLTMALAFNLIATLVFLPALLGPPPRGR